MFAAESSTNESGDELTRRNALMSATVLQLTKVATAT